ncbi:MAG: DUF4082 domain-containing protein [Microthrixaceae bacterium]
MLARRTSLVVVLLLALLAGVVPIALTRAAPIANPLGVFRGSGRADLVQEYEAWLGRPVGYTVDFIGRSPQASSSPWADIDNPGWWCRRWSSRTSILSLSTAMLPNSNFSLAAGARGEYDAHWRSFGRTLVDQGCEATILRLGWEFNGKFYPWAAGGKEAEFVAYWRRIVATLRTVPNQRFLFDWTPLAGNAGADVEAAYPGDAFVDIVGLDAYDISTVSAANREARWNDQVTRRYGLAWHRDFARAHGKPMSFPEWGVMVRPNDDLGGGDNPFYISRMWEWIHSNAMLYASYFEVDAADGSHRLMTGQFPASSARFRDLVNDGPAADGTSTPPQPSTTIVPSTALPAIGTNAVPTIADEAIATTSTTAPSAPPPPSPPTSPAVPAPPSDPAASVPSSALTIWAPTAAPQRISADTRPIEVGVKFRTDAAGSILGIRFFKSSANGGPHVASLWRRNGTLLAQVPFLAESESGWQQVLFPTPVDIEPGTTYVASYHSTRGRVADDPQTFTSNVRSGHLTALRSGFDGLNGVYAYGATPRFPANGARLASNYWVDVVFVAP